MADFRSDYDPQCKERGKGIIKCSLLHPYHLIALSLTVGTNKVDIRIHFDE